jgi:hypothetical protein
MTTMTSGAAVKSGYYLNLSRWAIEPVAKDGGRLPEGRGTWTKIPTVAALALVPILGATFLMFLPFIGFALVAQAMVAPVMNLFHASASDLAATMHPGWRPGEAHFTGKADESAGTEEKGPTSQGERLESLEREIAEKREGKKS